MLQRSVRSKLASLEDPVKKDEFDVRFKELDTRYTRTMKANDDSAMSVYRAFGATSWREAGKVLKREKAPRDMHVAIYQVASRHTTTSEKIKERHTAELKTLLSDIESALAEELITVEHIEEGARDTVIYTCRPVDVPTMDALLTRRLNDDSMPYDILKRILGADSARVVMSVTAQYKDTRGELKDMCTSRHRGRIRTIDEVNLADTYKGVSDDARDKMFHKSGLSIVSIKRVDIIMYHAKATRGGAWSEIPPTAEHKGVIVNPKPPKGMMDGDKCFLLCLYLHEAYEYARVGLKTPKGHTSTMDLKDSIEYIRHNISEQKKALKLSEHKRYYTSKGGYRSNPGIPTQSLKNYNLEGLTYPVDEAGVKRFMRNNPSVSVRVHHLDNEKDAKWMPSRSHTDAEDVINLAYWDGHYAYVTNVNTLLGHHAGRHTCHNCTTDFRSSVARDEHYEQCINNRPTLLEMPHAHSVTKFENYRRERHQPFTIVADFEAFPVAAQPGSKVGSATTVLQTHSLASWCFRGIVADMITDIDPSRMDKLTKVYKSPPPLHGTTAEEHETRMMKTFVEDTEELRALWQECYIDLRKKHASYDTSSAAAWGVATRVEAREAERKHRQKTQCMRCKVNAEEVKAALETEHCHLTGHILGKVCKHCNGTTKGGVRNANVYVPVYFHNGRGYDFHFVLRAYMRDGKVEPHTDDDETHVKPDQRWELTPLNNNTQKMMQIKVRRRGKLSSKADELQGHIPLMYRDSCLMLSSSLDTLIKNLNPEDRHNVAHVAQHTFPSDRDAQEMSMKKGVFPYTWFNHPGKLAGDYDHEACEQLGINPSTKKPESDYSTLKGQYKTTWMWYEQLSESYVSEELFERARSIFMKLDCSFKRYHDLYLEIDVAGLTDVLTYYRKSMHEAYGLDFMHYISIPAFSWDALLRMTGVRLDNISDKQMYAFFEDMTGGFTCVTTRHAKASTEGTTADTSLEYIDANNLYGWAMMQKLPHANFMMHDGIRPDPELEAILNGTKALDDARRGYRLDVTLEYPEELHDKHYDFPLAPYKRSIEPGECSLYQAYLAERSGTKQGMNSKLIADFNERRMKVDLTYLMFLKRHGLKVKEIHTVVSFAQKAWMKEFIEFNTERRSRATNDADKDMYKLMNNSVYGKTMENVRGRMNARVIHKDDTERLRAVQSRVNFALQHLDIDDYIILYEHNSRTRLDKPVYVGTTVLDHSKRCMASHLYDDLIPHFGRENIEVVYTDTDSFIYSVRPSGCVDHAKPMTMTEALQHDGFASKHMDTSNYPAKHPLYSDKHKKIPGFFKNECPDDPIIEFVGLAPKMYAYKTASDHEDKKAKGLSRSKVKSTLSVDAYRSCLGGQAPVESMTSRVIRSSQHTLRTIEQRKKGLSPYDEKRYIPHPGEHDTHMSLPYGYKGKRFSRYMT